MTAYCRSCQCIRFLQPLLMDKYGPIIKLLTDKILEIWKKMAQLVPTSRIFLKKDTAKLSLHISYSLDFIHIQTHLHFCCILRIWTKMWSIYLCKKVTHFLAYQKPHNAGNLLGTMPSSAAHQFQTLLSSFQHDSGLLYPWHHVAMLLGISPLLFCLRVLYEESDSKWVSTLTCKLNE